MSDKEDHSVAIVAVVAIVGFLGLLAFLAMSGRDKGGVLTVTPNPRDGGFTILERVF